MEKMRLHIPGFRSRAPLHMILAGVYYLFSISMMLVSISLGLLLLSGPFLLFNGHAAIAEYAKTKQARALISLFLSAALCGCSLIGFVVDMSGRQPHAVMDTAILMDTASPYATPDSTAPPAQTPSIPPSPAPLPVERAVVMAIGEGPRLHVQFADTSTGEVRFAGIRIGETIETQASDYLAQTLPPGSIVYLEQGDDPLDCYVWMAEPDSPDAEKAREKTLNALLVTGGLAAAEPDGKYAAGFAACQEEAQAACLGLWAVSLETAASTLPPESPSPTLTPEPAPSTDAEPVPYADTEPTTVPESADPPEPPGGVYYCGSKNSDVFHLSTCASAGRISPENLVIYASREDAIARGKRPCKKCKP